ncbi:MAG: hypothetical protein PHE09_10320 [Oscillospiraceae bacterium]|nr:hypothetical protein [Oscillospiraceae bacterium]
MNKAHDITGNRYGSLVALSRVENRGKDTAWLCLCDCGNKTVVKTPNLKNGHTKSCGCLKEKTSYRNNIKHGLSQNNGHIAKLYKLWSGIKDRCLNINNPHYKEYGGRGILICEDWVSDYEAFHKWAVSNGYKECLSIDRVNNNKGYSPDNCRFVTMTEQNRNKRNNITVEYRGRKMVLSELSEICGVNYKTLYKRVMSGWSVKDAAERPVRNMVERVD